MGTANPIFVDRYYYACACCGIRTPIYETARIEARHPPPRDWILQNNNSAYGIQYVLLCVKCKND